jgi:predicted ATP-binding protein involved in virulence
VRINRVVISGLFGRKGSQILNFHPDLNILTGKNGSGKTTVMKLIWYVISGKILNALTEINFLRIQIETDLYEIEVTRTGSHTCKVRWASGNEERLFEDGEPDEDGDFMNAEDIPNRRTSKIGPTIFFPTFRRIEGGFSINERDGFETGLRRASADIPAAFAALSAKLSNSMHVFVAAVATVDIERLLLKQYTDASEQANAVQQSTSENVIREIKEFKEDRAELQGDGRANSASAEVVLDKIKSMIETMEGERRGALSQYNAIRDLVMRILRHSGLKVGRLSFGDAAATINSDSLSAGEKQMLSFLCYNAFYDHGCIFIDEPELSLHVDWQRQLFPTLFNQEKENQFIIATHSPFIYSRYPDREIKLQDDRGDTNIEDLIN